MLSFGNLKIEIQGYDPRPRVSSICGSKKNLGSLTNTLSEQRILIL
jgi:hypothetical protein